MHALSYGKSNQQSTKGDQSVMPKNKKSDDNREFAESRLREWLKPNKDDRDRSGTEIRCITTTVSRTGMSRRIVCLIAVDGKVVDITWEVGHVIGWPVGPKGIKVDGCGMDMHFHVVYTLAHDLFGNGYLLNYRSLRDL